MEKTKKKIVRTNNRKIICFILVVLLSFQILPSTLQLKTKADTPIPKLNDRMAEDNLPNDKFDFSWENLQTKLNGYGGEWKGIADMSGAFSVNMPTTALLGNGDVGVTSYAENDFKSYLFSKGDFWSCGNLRSEDVHAQTQNDLLPLPIGGLKIKQSRGENAPLKVQSVETSSTMDTRHSDTIINGMLEGETSNPKIWVSNVIGTDTTTVLPTDKELTIILDLGEKKSIAKYVIYHANANDVGRAPFNTAKYEVFTSDDKTAWTSINKVEDNTSDYNETVLDQAVECRYFKVKINQPEQKVDSVNYYNRARISEIELYSASNGTSALLDSVKPNVVPDDSSNKPLTYAPNVNTEESSNLFENQHNTIVNGVLDSDPKYWISNFVGDATHQGDPTPSITIDLGEPKQVEKYVLYHAGIVSDNKFNPKSYKIYAGNDKNNLEEIEFVQNNSKNMTKKVLDAPITAQFFKVVYLEPEQKMRWDVRARLVEFEIYSSKNDYSSLYPKNEDTFYEKQNIAQAELDSSIVLGQPLQINTFLSADKNILVSKVKSTGLQNVKLDVELYSATSSIPYPIANGKDDEKKIVWTSRKTLNLTANSPAQQDSWTSEAVIASKIVGKNVSLSTGNNSASMLCELKPNEEVYIVTAIGGGGKNYSPSNELISTQPLAQAIGLLDSITDIEQINLLRTNHQDWWKNYWLRSLIDIPDEALMKYYYGSIYLSGCVGRADTMAPGLYGLWVTTDRPMWNGDFHLNYNAEATYYGIFKANRLDMAKAFCSNILDYMPKGELAAKQDLRMINPTYVDSRPDLANGIDNAVLYPVSLGAYGNVSWYSRDRYLGQTFNALFASTVFMFYYEHTLDKDWLLNSASEFLKKVANFYLAWREKENLSNGDYVYNIFDSYCENYDYNMDSPNCAFRKNSCVTIGLNKKLFAFLNKYSADLNASDEEIKSWKDMNDHLADIPTAKIMVDGEQLEILVPNDDPLFSDKLTPDSFTILTESVFPGDNINFGSDPKWLEIGKNNIRAFVANQDNRPWMHINGTAKIYPFSMRVNYDPQFMIDNFKKYQLNIMQPNFTLHDTFHGIEKIGAMEFINGMLLQNSNNIIKVFPNWTGENASFKNLLSKGAFEVSSQLIDNVTQYISINSKMGGKAQVVIPQDWKDKCISIVDKQGTAVNFTVNNSLVPNASVMEFDTSKGQNYEISCIDHNYVSVVTSPTCTEQGYTTHTCSECGHSYIDSYVDAKGHSFGEWVITKNPTVNDEGERKRVCAECGVEEVEKIDKLPTPDKPDPDKPNPDKPDHDKPDPDKPNPDKPDPDKPTPDKPDPDKPNPDKPNPETPTPDKPIENEKKGCGADVSSSSSIYIGILLGFSLLVLKRKRKVK